jgi:hypothetical protein
MGSDKENNQEFIFSVQFSNVAGAIGNAQNDGNSQCSLFATYSGGSSARAILLLFCANKQHKDIAGSCSVHEFYA